MSTNETDLNRVFKEKVEKFIKDNNLVPFDVTYKINRNGKYERVVLTFYASTNDGDEYADMDSIELGILRDGETIAARLAKISAALRGLEIIPVYEYRDTNCEEPIFAVFTKDELSQMQFTKFLYTSEIYTLWENTIKGMCDKPFTLSINGLTMDEYNCLKQKENEIVAYLKKLAKG